jgi:hypothetical protein
MGKPDISVTSLMPRPTRPSLASSKVPPYQYLKSPIGGH